MCECQFRVAEVQRGVVGAVQAPAMFEVAGRLKPYAARPLNITDGNRPVVQHDVCAGVDKLVHRVDAVRSRHNADTNRPR
jgi:hypothetical protein